MRLGLAVLLLLPLLACAGRGTPDPATDSDRTLGQFLDPEAAGSSEALPRLVADFYSRISNRRVNSIATYQDPGLREFFRTEQSWSDYYAELVQTLDDAHFEAVRPTGVEVQSIDMQSGVALSSQKRAVVTVKLTGENGLPLRWWTISLVRKDRWEEEGGRWWIVPGKL